ncbi:Adenylate and Guanylate cyclase catalytic domain containing protein [Tritrichomonas foetus]|uniref:Adenylate and Guanylate cyclase catalytic domain containing protein n=1 Tax=Tritrichomonas foetus TaxID=1144522 RepID=A0A1J4KQG6_9EUKA|nr:Adenylate and Guanylate cyclase catalytic domain containing protein [Tritrichomonas foetus]|eukprot:OHT13545.1 Adenylate and Guanylate cyclase catalytic domain containing protein [Tritrichomonas foetus]
MTNVTFNDESTIKSLTARSASEFGQSPKGDRMSSKLSSYIDETLIPILAEANRLILNKNIFRIFSTLVFYAQFILGGYFLLIPSTPRPDWLNYLSKVFFLKSYDFPERIYQYNFIIINLITFISVFAISLDFIINHKFRRWILYFLRIWHGHLYNIIIIPTTVVTFYSFKIYGENPTISNALICLFNLIGLVYCWAHLFFILIVLEQNPYLTRLLFHYWKPTKLYMNVVINGLVFGICAMSIFFDNWARFIPQIIVLLLVIFRIKIMKELSYESIYMNAFHHSYCFFTIATSILSIVFDITGYNSYYVYYLVPATVYLISFIILLIYIQFKTNRIINELQGNDELQSLDQKNQFFDTLNLSLSDSYYYLQIGLQHNCPLFLDWSLSQYILSRFPNNMELTIFTTWETSFFPSESHLFHCFLTAGLKLPNPAYYIKTHFYQLQRVHIFRQSQVSSESASDLTKIQQKTQMCIDLVSFFWESVANKQHRVSTCVANHVYRNLYEADAIWEEVLEKYPNNAAVAREYSRYLLDAQSSFQSSILWNQKSILLESGTALHSDKMFRCFLKMYPNYLKNKIVDTKGNLNKGKFQRKNSNSDVNNNLSSRSTDDDSSDTIDIEEAFNFLPDYKLRMALERSIRQKASPIINTASLSALFRLALCLGFIVASFILITAHFDPRMLRSSYLIYMNKVGHSFELLTHEMSWLYFSSFPQISNTSKMIDLYTRVLGPQANNITYYFNLSRRNLSYAVYNLSRESLHHLDDFASRLYLYNEEADGLIQLFTRIYSKMPINYTMCGKNSDGLFVIQIPDGITFDLLLRSFLTLIIKLLSDTKEERQLWDQDNDFCEIFLQTELIQTSFYDLVGILSESVTSKYDSEFDQSSTYYVSTTIQALLTYTPFVMLLLVLPNIVFMTSGIDRDKELFIKMIFSVLPEDAQKASQTLFKYEIDSKEKKAKKITSFDFKQNLFNPYVFVNIGMFVVLGILLIIVIFSTLQLDTTIDNLNDHFQLTFLERNILIDMGRDATYLVFLNQMNTDPIFHDFSLFPQEVSVFATPEKAYHLLENDFQKYQEITQIIDNGGNRIKSATGFESKIDNFRQESLCTTQPSDSVIDFVNCLSLDRVISYYTGRITHIKNMYNQTKIWDEVVVEISHIIESRFALDYNNLMDLYSDIINSKLDNFILTSSIFFGVEIVFAILIYIFEYVMIQSIKKEFSVYLSLVLRIDPIAIANNHNIVSWIYGSSSTEKKILTPAHAIFHVSNDAMLLISTDSIIESLNPAATTIFGYTPEQMLGQNIRLLIPPDDNTQFYYYMDLMSKCQTVLTFESTAIGKCDNGANCPLKISLIGLSSSNMKRATYFALLMKDMTEDELQNEAVENAKKQANMILAQILPKDIIGRINKGDRDISFTVNCASVIFIDIEKFSVYASSLTANDIMRNLSKIFTTFEKISMKFDMITKIKLIGDIYMAAGGLFNPDAEPSTHADQVIQFGLQALDAIEELNIQLNANLQIRIGVNTDGPLIAGVLGAERPLFDIVGGPILVAAKLQQTDVAGSIQISEGTYKHIAGTCYRIVQRGLMNLGNGVKQLTYFVQPNDSDNKHLVNMNDTEDDESSDSSMKLTKMVSKTSLITSQVTLMRSRSKASFTNLLALEPKTTLHGVQNSIIHEE